MISSTANATTYPETTRPTAPSDACRSAPIDGPATLATAVSILAMNWPVSSTARIAPRLTVRVSVVSTMLERCETTVM